MNTSNQTFVNNLRDKYSTKPQMQTYHESPSFVFDKGHTT